MFKIILGNPAYQDDDDGHGRSAKTIYPLFINMAKSLDPKYICMIIPARWYSAGKGVSTFREEMLNDRCIRVIVDFENPSEVFPEVDIAGGVCYFLRNRDEEGLCRFVNRVNGETIESERDLSEFKILIRHQRAIPIVRKVLEVDSEHGFLNNVVSTRKPFSIEGGYTPLEDGIPCHFKQAEGLKFASPDDVNDEHNLRGRWKLLIPRAPIAGQTDFSQPVQIYYDGNIVIAKPGEVCSESWLVAYSAATREEIESFKSYLLTKTVRFLLLLAVISQDIPRDRFVFVPHLGEYKQTYTDEMLRERWNINDEEWEFIDSKIRTTGKYEQLTVEKLKEELLKNELPITGSKAELVQRMYEFEEQQNNRSEILRMAAIAAVLSLIESKEDVSQRGRQPGEAWSQDHRRLNMGKSSLMHYRSSRSPWR